METRGRHLLAEYRGCIPARLDDPAAVERLLRRAAEAAGATIVAACFERVAPGGVAGVVVVEESHLSIHTCPERGYAAVDFFTCGACDPEDAHRVIADGVGARQSELLTVHRGLEGAEAMRLGPHWLEGDGRDVSGASVGRGHGDVFHGPLTAGWQVNYACRGVLLDRQTAIQRVTLLDTDAFGRALLLDSDLTSASSDEFIYHETLVHPALSRARAPRRVLIVGGGGGGTLREVLRWQTVEQAVVIDIDGELVDLCRAHLSDVYGDPYADPRATLHIGDGRAYVERSVAGDPDPSKGFDVIVIDMPDTAPGSPARRLYTREFYGSVRRALRPGGVVIAQGGAVGATQHRRLVATLAAVFDSTASLGVYIPSFSAAWAFVLAGEALERTPAQIEHALAEAGVDGLRAYGGAVDRAMSTLLPSLRAGLAEGAEVWTDAALAAEGAHHDDEAADADPPMRAVEGAPRRGLSRPDGTRARHLLVEYRACDGARLDDAAEVEALLRRAAEAAGLHIEAACFHGFAPQGTTGVVLSASAHLSIHTWPEHGYAAVDLFTAGSGDVEGAHRVIGEGLGAVSSTAWLVERGLGEGLALRTGLPDQARPPPDGPQRAIGFASAVPGVGEPPRSGGMFYESPIAGTSISYACREVLVDRHTGIQRMMLVDTEAFGRALFLDGDLNSAASDEFVYHEALVHPAMARACSPRRVLVIGGGEGGALREVLRWQTVEQAVMVDIDHGLVELCRAHLRDVYGDPYADPRVELHIGDGRAFVERHARPTPEAPGGFDVVIIDLPDATAQSPVRWLHTREFYRSVRRALRPGGVVIAQASALGSRPHRRLAATIGEAFDTSVSLEMFIPSFTNAWAFVLGGAALDRSPGEVDAALAAAGVAGLRAYDGAVDARMGTLLPATRAGLADGGEVWTDATLLAETVPRPG